jgi:hypothetical protein
MFRAFRVRKTGQWVAPAYSDERFDDDGSEQAERVATALELEAGSLEVVDAETDPRSGDLLAEPEKEKPQPSPRDVTRAKAKEDLRGAKDLGEVKAALEVLL